MADCFSNYLRDKINDHIHGGPDFTRPGTTYWALMTAMPTASGGGTEASGGSYARVAFTNTTNWSASSGQVKANATTISWGTLTATLGTIVGVAEYDASTGGNLLTFMPLNTAVSISAGQPFEIPAAGASFGWAA
jgi:hypothetical protein